MPMLTCGEAGCRLRNGSSMQRGQQGTATFNQRSQGNWNWLQARSSPSVGANPDTRDRRQEATLCPTRLSALLVPYHRKRMGHLGSNCHDRCSASSRFGTSRAWTTGTAVLAPATPDGGEASYTGTAHAGVPPPAAAQRTPARSSRGASPSDVVVVAPDDHGCMQHVGRIEPPLAVVANGGTTQGDLLS